LNPILKNRFAQLEEDRVNLLASLAPVPDKTLSSSPTVGKWSINQILIHLLTSEQLTLAYLKKKSLGIDGLKNSGAWEWIKMQILKWSQRLPFLKYNAPKHLKANTPEAVSLEELGRRWSVLRIELHNFLDTIEESNLRKLIYKHPVAGRFDVIQCLMFMREHYHHHLPQIKRLL
jgi:hypothetical protein